MIRRVGLERPAHGAHGPLARTKSLGVVVAHHGNVEAALRRHAAVRRAVGGDAADDLRGPRDAAHGLDAPLFHNSVQRAQDLEARLVARASRQAPEQRRDGARGQVVGREAVERVDGRLQRRRRQVALERRDERADAATRRDLGREVAVRGERGQQSGRARVARTLQALDELRHAALDEAREQARHVARGRRVVFQESDFVEEDVHGALPC